MTEPGIVNVHEAKTHLSRLLERVGEGEEIVIGKAGKPIAKLVPYVAVMQKHTPGALKGQIWYADDWDSDEVNREIAAAFYGEDDE